MPNFDFARPFQFVFQDPEWIKKVLIGAAFQLLGVFTFFLFGAGGWPFAGYLVRIVRNVADGRDELPEWNVGEDFGLGMRVVGIMLCYTLPAMLVFAVGFGVSIAITAAAGNQNDAASSIGALMIVGSECLGGFLLLVSMILGGLGVLRFADTNEFASAFQFGAIFRLLKDNAVNILLMIVVGFIANFISQFGVILCLIGVFVTATWARYALAQAAGQVLKIDRARTNAPVPTSPASSAARAY